MFCEVQVRDIAYVCLLKQMTRESWRFLYMYTFMYRILCSWFFSRYYFALSIVLSTSLDHVNNFCCCFKRKGKNVFISDFFSMHLLPLLCETNHILSIVKSADLSYAVTFCRHNFKWFSSFIIWISLTVKFIWEKGSYNIEKCIWPGCKIIYLPIQIRKATLVFSLVCYGW